MMLVDVIHPGDLGTADRARWQDLQSRNVCPDNPFMGPVFTTAVARLKPTTRVAVIRAGGRVGFFPFEPGHGRHGRALAMGLSDLQGLVADPSLQVDPVDLLEKCGLRSFTFDHLTARHKDWLRTAPSRVSTDISRVLDLSGGYDAWVTERKAVSKSLFQNTARKLRKLEREHGAVHLVYDYPDHSALDRLLDWKSHQYRRTSRRDVFADPANRAFVHDLLERRDAHFTAPLSILAAGDTMIAAHFGLRSSRTLAWWFPVYDTAFSAYSPGLVLCMEIARAVSANGATILDLGKGDEPYKERLSNSSIELLSGSVATTRRTRTVQATLRWPREHARRMVLSSPRLRRACRAALAQAGEIRVGGAPSPSAGYPVIAMSPLGVSADTCGK